MNRPVEATHPAFKSLWGYYNFDDLKDETSVNWVGKGHQAYHIRNGRNKYNEKLHWHMQSPTTTLLLKSLTETNSCSMP